jgi:hypothetical protein
MAPTEDEPLCLLSSLQHDQLMPKRDDFGLHRRSVSKAGEKGPERH